MIAPDGPPASGPNRLTRALRRLFARREARAPSAERIGATAPAGHPDPSQAVEDWADDPSQAIPTRYADPEAVIVNQETLEATVLDVMSISLGTGERVPDVSFSAAWSDLRRWTFYGVFAAVLALAGVSLFAETTKTETLLTGAGTFAVFLVIGTTCNIVRLRHRRRTPGRRR